VMGAPSFWVLLVVVPVIAFLPDLSFKSWTLLVRPKDAQIVREQNIDEIKGGERKESDHLLRGIPQPKYKLIPSSLSHYTGYAFAGERGAGDVLRVWFNKIRKQDDQGTLDERLI